MAICPACGAEYPDDARVCEVDGEELLQVRPVLGKTEDLKEGDAVGEYQIIAKIGEGAFGAVYSATHRLIGKKAAIKVLNPERSSSAQMVARFLVEARAVNQIRHKNIVDIFSFGALDDGRQYCIMELLEGATLKAHLEDKGKLEPEEALQILSRVARALDAAHAAGIAHRDLKPDNVFLVTDEDGVAPKLLDFGIAKLLDDSQSLHTTAAGAMIGTPLYMSPEQWRGRGVDHRSDIYALGVMTFELLSNQYPFLAESQADLLFKVQKEDPRPLSSVCDTIPAGVDEVLARMLARDPEERPQKAMAAIEQLAAAFAQAGVAVGAGLTTIAAPPSGTARSEATAAATAADSDWPSRPAAATTTAGSAVGRGETEPPKSRGWLVAALVLGAIAAAVVALVVRSSEETAPAPTGPPVASTSMEVPDAQKVPARPKRSRWWEQLEDGDDQAVAALPEAKRGWLEARSAAEALVTAGKLDHAETKLRQLVDFTRQELGERDAAYFATLELLAEVLARQGKIEEAEKVLREAVAVQAKYGDPGDEEFDDARKALVAVLLKQGKADEAKDFWKEGDPPLPDEEPKPTVGAGTVPAPATAAVEPSAEEPEPPPNPFDKWKAYDSDGGAR